MNKFAYNYPCGRPRYLVPIFSRIWQTVQYSVVPTLALLLVLAVGMVGLVSLSMNISKTMFLASLQASMVVCGQLRSSMQ